MNDKSKALVVTRMDGPDDAAQNEHLNPTWRDIEAAIRRLDGMACTLLILGIGEPPAPHMAIAGGSDGQYIVYTTSDNDVFRTLINPSAPPGKRLLVAGGQRGDYDNSICVTLQDALWAAKTYAESGENEPALVWEKR